ncbi:hypothetical protein EBR43_11515 [bacterium]|nr:hypothetical protein [bacterium]
MITTSEKESVRTTTYRLFMVQYHEHFNHFLHLLDDSTKHLIRNNKQLNNMYDLFLDFVLDSGQLLESGEKK